MKVIPLPSKAELNKLFTYNPTNGKLFNRIALSPRARAGQEAGSFVGNGYRRVGISGTKYLAHRIIWKMITGADPGDQIDHINHRRANNRFKNLRAVSKQENQRNASRRKDNTSGVCGVSWRKDTKKWEAKIRFEGKKIHLGIFKHRFHAIRARKLAEAGYGFHPNHGSAA